MTENREKAIKRTKNLAYWFMGEMLKEEERGEKEKEAFEKAKEAGELVVMISTAENNARVMKSCMKEAREAAEFLRDEKNDVEDWQLAGINAMFDQCNKENMVPYANSNKRAFVYAVPISIQARVAQWIAQQPPKLPGAGSSPAPCITGKATINSYQIQGGIPHENIINYQSQRGSGKDHFQRKHGTYSGSSKRLQSPAD